jgi:hypothetical protein
MKRKIFTGLFLAFLSGILFSQDIVFPELAGFKKITKYPVFVPENLWDFIDGAADTYLALGFVDLHVAEYKKGKDVIKLEIYRHSNHTMAFGIYTSERSSSYSFMNLGSQGYFVDGAINFFKGNYYVKIRTYSGKPKILSSEQSLAKIVEGMLTGETDMPTMLSKFPGEGKKLNEETFINESVLGHQFIKKAFKAVYQTGSDNFNLFIIKSGSPEETLKTAKDYLAVGDIETDQPEGRFIFTDGYNGTIFLSWKDDMMVIISGLAKDQADIADKYTSEILN